MAEGAGCIQPGQKDGGTWFNCGFGSTELTVELNDPRASPKWFYDSTKNYGNNYEYIYSVF